MLALGIYNRYPRKVAKDAALKAIDKAISAVSKRGSAGAVGDEEAAAQWLGSRGDLYAKSPQARQPDKSKVPYPASWFNAGRYDDDDTEWQHVGFEKPGSKGFTPQPENLSAIDHKAGLRQQSDGSFKL